jgi:hypothetical protein
MWHRWRVTLLFVIAVTSAWTLATSISPFKQLAKALFKKYLWAGPGLLFFAGAVLLVCTIFFNRLVVRLNITLLLPLFLLACFGLNTWRFSDNNIKRLPTNSIIDLFKQPYDAFENFPVYVLMSGFFEGRTLVANQDLLKELKMSPWEFQAYARLSKVEIQPFRHDLSSEEVQQILRLPHISLKVRVLGHKDGRWFVVPRKFVLITEPLHSNSPLGIARHSDQVIIVTFSQLPDRQVE